MKLLYLQILLYVSFISIGQNDNFDRQLFYKIGIAATLTINSEGLSSDDDSSCIVPNALFVKNTFGIAVNKRISMGLNAELDWHSKPNLLYFLQFIQIYDTTSFKKMIMALFDSVMEKCLVKEN